MMRVGTVPADQYDWPDAPGVGAGHGQRLCVGDVVLADPDSGSTWWLVVGPSAQIGMNSILMHGPMPAGFTDRRTHWSDGVVRAQLAIVNPPKPWPDDVLVAIAAFALTRRVPSGHADPR